MHRAQAIGGPALAGLLRFVLTARLVILGGHRIVVVVFSGFRRAGRAPAAAPPPAPSWFGLLAVRHPSDSSCHEDSLPPHSPVVTEPLHIRLSERGRFSC